MLKAPILLNTHLMPIYWTMTIIVMVSILIVSFFVGRNLQLVPNKVQTFFETIILMVGYFLNEIIGEEGSVYFPLIASFAIFILFSNLLGSIPGFTSPTSFIATTATLALIVFFLSHIVGIKKHGIKYVKKFMGPIIFIAPFMIIIEIMSALSRPLSHSLRLFANIFAEEFMVTVLLFLAPWGIPVIIMFFQIFTDILQTFVFFLLAIIYITLALEEV
jgi:F-type H+-transporting ATPase subunit a